MKVITALKAYSYLFLSIVNFYNKYKIQKQIHNKDEKKHTIYFLSVYIV